MTATATAQSAATAPEHQWVTLSMAPQYDIDANYPHYLRKNGKVLQPYCTSNSGYYSYGFSDLPEKLHHRIIASQFVANDDPLSKRVVDHINGDGKDNHITNLQWLSQSDNIRKCKSYTQQPKVVIQQLPADAVPLGLYEGHSYSRYYIVPAPRASRDGGASADDSNTQRLIMVLKRPTAQGAYKYVNATPYRHGGFSQVTIYDDDGVKHMRGLTKILKHVNARNDDSPRSQSSSPRGERDH